jgi:hypothetical protein
MKKPSSAKRPTPPARRGRRPAVDRDDVLPEYDFSGARRNKYAARYAGGTNVVLLDPDVAAVFSTPEQVNDALRALAGIIEKRRPRPRARRTG